MIRDEIIEVTEEVIMPVEQQVPADAPVMKAWNAYKSTEDYANSRLWAQHEQHVDGSLWAVFYRGFYAAAMVAAENSADVAGL